MAGVAATASGARTAAGVTTSTSGAAMSTRGAAPTAGGDAPLTVDELVAFCLAKPGATEDYPWGDGELTAKVSGKVFAFIGLGENGTVGVKCGADADEAAVVRERHPGAITVMAYVGRYGWNTVRLADVPGDEVRELVDASYDDVVARLPRSRRPAAAATRDAEVTAAGERAATT